MHNGRVGHFGSRPHMPESAGAGLDSEVVEESDRVGVGNQAHLSLITKSRVFNIQEPLPLKPDCMMVAPGDDLQQVPSARRAVLQALECHLGGTRRASQLR